jgi:hypothetical protein
MFIRLIVNKRSSSDSSPYAGLPLHVPDGDLHKNREIAAQMNATVICYQNHVSYLRITFSKDENVLYFRLAIQVSFVRLQN